MTTSELHKIDKAFGDKLKAARRLRGMSQSDLGTMCGISFQQIQKYEAGANRVAVSRLFQLADALDVSPTDLLPKRASAHVEAV